LVGFTEELDEVISKIRKCKEDRFNQKYDLDEYWPSHGAYWVRCPSPTFSPENGKRPIFLNIMSSFVIF
jgi:rRNA maturation protein Nop10